MKQEFHMSEPFDLLNLMARMKKYESPPIELLNEISKDNITDIWEVKDKCVPQNKSNGLSPPCKTPAYDYQPVIGILTQPVSKSKKGTFNYKDYILEVNDNFIRWAGSRTVAIPFDISDSDLNKLLPQINGVLLTGGALDLHDNKTGTYHPYYLTAKKIFKYSKFMKDSKDEEWPILGIC